ncbi:MAG: hypothetical protein KTR21_15185 [Rhodobacteraceae bacterium]|nr:hypothetical protein [Paracoccaceae bacterium]
MFRVSSYGALSVALAAFSLSACATIVEGTDQPLTVYASEAGATCEFTRDGQLIGAVAQTPGTLVLDKSRNDVSGVCRKEGFQDSTVIIEPNMVATTAGNILAGGLVGIAVDAASGANFSYPQSVYFLMAPNSFLSETERDQFFAKAEDRIHEEFTPQTDKAGERCERANDETCFALQTLEERRSAQLNDLQAQKQQAQIVTPTPLSPGPYPSTPPSVLPQ